MDNTKENKEKDKNTENAKKWAYGTVVTGALPYAFMLIGWVAGGYSKPIYYYYTGIADSAAFMYSVSLCLLLLCLDYDKKIEEKKRNKGIRISLTSALISAMFYFVKTNSDVVKKIELMLMKSDKARLQFLNQNVTTDFLDIKVGITSIIMLIITMWFVYLGYQIYKNNEEMSEEAKNEDGNDGSQSKQVRSGQESSEINQGVMEIRGQEDAETNI